MRARNLDVELSGHQFGDAGKVLIVKPIQEVNTARFQDCLYPPIRFEPGPSGLHIRLTSDAEILSTEISAIPERSRDCRNLLRHRCLRVPEAAVRGYCSRIAGIMLIIDESATCAS